MFSSPLMTFLTFKYSYKKVKTAASIFHILQLLLLFIFPSVYSSLLPCGNITKLYSRSTVPFGWVCFAIYPLHWIFSLDAYLYSLHVDDTAFRSYFYSLLTDDTGASPTLVCHLLLPSVKSASYLTKFVHIFEVAFLFVYFNAAFSCMSSSTGWASGEGNILY